MSRAPMRRPKFGAIEPLNRWWITCKLSKRHLKEFKFVQNNESRRIVGKQPGHQARPEGGGMLPLKNTNAVIMRCSLGAFPG
jgi:hypothetical protein